MSPVRKLQPLDIEGHFRVMRMAVRTALKFNAGEVFIVRACPHQIGMKGPGLWQSEEFVCGRCEGAKAIDLARFEGVDW